MLVIAHRGASAERPENTLPAFERAIELGADFVELDVHADSAGRLVVTHGRPRPRGDYPTLEEALALMRGRIGVMIELKTPGRYRRHDVVARTVRLMSTDDVLVCFQRAPLEQARSLRRGFRERSRDAPRRRNGSAARARAARLHRERRGSDA